MSFQVGTYGTSPGLKGGDPFESKASKKKQHAMENELTNEEKATQIAKGVAIGAAVVMPQLAIAAGIVFVGNKILDIAKDTIKDHNSSAGYTVLK